MRSRVHRVSSARGKVGFWIFLCVLGMFSPKAMGEIPAAFVDIGYGARPMGMGGAYVALASDAYAVFWNPACLSYVRGWQVSTMYAKQFGLIPYALVSAAKEIGGHGIGVAALSAGDDVLRETTVFLAYGRKLEVLGPTFRNLALGLTLKFRTASFGNNPDGGELRSQGSSVGYGLDLGMRWKFAPRWTMGILLRDAMNQVSYDNETRGVQYGEAVPTALIMGTAFLARPNLVFVLDWDKALHSDMRDKILVGCEWRVFNIIFLRGGWSQSLDTEPNRKVNCGIGLQYFRKDFGVRFDFAYQLHFLATTPRISVSCWF